MMKATELHARLGGTLHLGSAVSRAARRALAAVDAGALRRGVGHPAERREVVVFNRRCYENRSLARSVAESRAGASRPGESHRGGDALRRAPGGVQRCPQCRT